MRNTSRISPRQPPTRGAPEAHEPPAVTAAGRLSRRLESELSAKGYAPGDRFPSVRDLSRRYRVSPITAHRAIQRLTAHGLLEARHGAGTFVRRVAAPSVRSLPKLLIVLPADPAIRRRFIIGGLQTGLLEALGGVTIQINTLPATDVSSFLGRLCEEAGSDALMGAMLVRVPREARLFFVRRRLPAVVIGHSDQQDALPYVDRDQRAIGRTVGAYLAGKGHTSVGLVMFETWSDADNLVNLGMLEAMANAPMASRRVICQSVNEEPALLTPVLERLLSGPHRPGAVVARSDHIAVAVVDVARRLGLKIPQQLAIVSIGQNGPSLVESHPTITAMTNDDEKRGRVAGRLLVELSHGRTPAQPYVEVESELITRESA